MTYVKGVFSLNMGDIIVFPKFLTKNTGDAVVLLVSLDGSLMRTCLGIKSPSTAENWILGEVPLVGVLSLGSVVSPVGPSPPSPPENGQFKTNYN